MKMIPYSDLILEKIYAACLDKKCRTIAVCGSIEGEGISTVAFSLANRAHIDKQKVLLVDFNLPHHEITDSYNLTYQSFESDDESYLENIQVVNKLGFSIFPAPIENNICTRFRGKKNIQKAINLWQAAYDLIIFDTTPVLNTDLQTIPPIQIASLTDMVLFVVLGAHTSESVVQQALDEFEDAGVRIHMNILNCYKNPKLSDVIIHASHALDKLMPCTMSKLRSFIQRTQVAGSDT